MGTRHLIAAKVGGEYKLAQYGQWDGYPSGQGVDVLAFLKGADLNVFFEKLAQCRWITQDEYNAMWAACGADLSKDNVPVGVAKEFSSKHSWLSRDCGSDVLGLIASSTAGLALKNSLDFAADSLFCEYGYVVDGDLRTFEVYKGFNKDPLPAGERLGGMAASETGSAGYSPIKLAKSYSLDALPSKDQFLADLAEDGDE